MPNLALRPRFDSTQIAAARAFNKEKEGVVFDARRLPEPLRSLAPDSDLFAWVVFLDQYYGGLGVDGKLGENTVSLYPQARITAHVAENPAFDATALERAAGRAKSAVDLGIKYKLGKGGFKKSQPRRPRPDDAGHCDCSGFVSWVVEVQRDPTNPMGDWLETTRMVRDATSAQKLFVAIPTPVPGCIVAYPDVNGHEGHTGVVTRADPLSGVDCSAGQNGIVERPFGFFLRRSDHVFMVLKSWILAAGMAVPHV